MPDHNIQPEPPPDNSLARWISEQIQAAGPVPFARFMEWALYHPTLGYYSRGPRIGISGDFVTSPEASPAFGSLLADHVAEIDALLGNPERFTLVEFGPGNGTLMSDLLAAVKPDNPELYARMSVWLVEVSPALREVQKQRLAAHRGKLRWADSPKRLPRGLSGTLLANEVLDAFPVHVLESHEGQLVEHFVDTDDNGGLKIVLKPLSDPTLAEFVRKSGIDLTESERIEVNLALDGWLREVADAWERGVFTFIDYGDTAPGRYSPSRKEGTLLGFYGGAVTDNLLTRPGWQDLTALVDFTHLAAAAEAANLEVIGATRQANFLIGLGLGTGETAIGVSDDLNQALAARKGIMSLISPEGLGRFHVVLIAKGVDAKAAKRLSALKYAAIT